MIQSLFLLSALVAGTCMSFPQIPTSNSNQATFSPSEQATLHANINQEMSAIFQKPATQEAVLLSTFYAILGSLSDNDAHLFLSMNTNARLLLDYAATDDMCMHANTLSWPADGGDDSLHNLAQPLCVTIGRDEQDANHAALFYHPMRDAMTKQWLAAGIDSPSWSNPRVYRPSTPTSPARSFVFLSPEDSVNAKEDHFWFSVEELSKYPDHGMALLKAEYITAFSKRPLPKDTSNSLYDAPWTSQWAVKWYRRTIALLIYTQTFQPGDVAAGHAAKIWGAKFRAIRSFLSFWDSHLGSKGGLTSAICSALIKSPGLSLGVQGPGTDMCKQGASFDDMMIAIGNVRAFVDTWSKKSGPIVTSRLAASRASSRTSSLSLNLPAPPPIASSRLETTEEASSSNEVSHESSKPVEEQATIESPRIVAHSMRSDHQPTTPSIPTPLPPLKHTLLQEIYTNLLNAKTADDLMSHPDEAKKCDQYWRKASTAALTTSPTPHIKQCSALFPSASSKPDIYTLRGAWKEWRAFLVYAGRTLFLQRHPATFDTLKHRATFDKNVRRASDQLASFLPYIPSAAVAKELPEKDRTFWETLRTQSSGARALTLASLASTDATPATSPSFPTPIDISTLAPRGVAELAELRVDPKGMKSKFGNKLREIKQKDPREVDIGTYFKAFFEQDPSVESLNQYLVLDKTVPRSIPRPAPSKV